NNLNLYNATLATTAWIIDGSLAITYTPVATTLTVNMTKFSGQVSARWYDPSKGIFQPAVNGTAFFPNTGTQAFTTPGTNSDGNNDWVLVLSVVPWSGVTAPSRVVDWNQAGVVGGIPNRTNICSTLT